MRTARKTVTAAAAGLLVAAGACLPAALGTGSASSIASTPSDQWQPVASAPAPVANPLKGFMPFAPDDGSAPPSASDGLGYTMEWTYMPVSSVVTGYHAYDFSAFEARLNQIGQRGHQTVFRFYLDYPGRPTGVPQYLIDQGIDTSRTYTVFDNNRISFSPDYNDSRVQDMILDFVRALGQKYDGDARIGFITAGLIGFWGENHTWPMNGETSADNPKGENWMPAQDFQDRLVAAWDDAFNTTAVQYREPSAATKAHGMGYHDDSFAYSTLDNVDWHFMSHMKAEHEEDAWQHAPIGGEVYPPLQTCIFSQPLNCPGADAEKAQGRNFDMDASLDATHATWLMNHKAFSEGYTGADLERAKAANARMGYVLSATRARASVSEPASNGAGTRTVSVETEIANSGLAPFYADWPLEFALLDPSGAVVGTQRAGGVLPTIQPGASATARADITVPADAGDLAVTMRVVNPLPGGAPVAFANEGMGTRLEGALTLPLAVSTLQTGPAPSPSASPDPAGTATQAPADPGAPTARPTAGTKASHLANTGSLTAPLIIVAAVAGAVGALLVRRKR